MIRPGSTLISCWLYGLFTLTDLHDLHDKANSYSFSLRVGTKIWFELLTFCKWAVMWWSDSMELKSAYWLSAKYGQPDVCSCISSCESHQWRGQTAVWTFSKNKDIVTVRMEECKKCEQLTLSCFCLLFSATCICCLRWITFCSKSSITSDAWQQKTIFTTCY